MKNIKHVKKQDCRPVVDLHSHILPGVDDGSPSMDVTKQMIKLSYAEGCKHLFLTPHAFSFEYENLKFGEKLAAIREWIYEEGMDLKVYLGSEIYVDPEYEEDTDSILEKLKTGIYPTLNSSSYVLVEFSLRGFVFEEIFPTIKALIAAGYIPVIAHAERYDNCFEDLCVFKETGCLLQMNLCDLYYYIENDINRMTHRLLRAKMYDFVGTDAHGITRRPPKLKEYVDFLYRHYDEEYVDGILYQNAVNRLGLITS